MSHKTSKAFICGFLLQTILVFLGINGVHSLFNLASQLLDKEIEILREKNEKKNGSFSPAIVVEAAKEQKRVEFFARA